jgi:sugar O-acyltransferase (sialic acid O-acetyltransferase NeuD family)
MNKIAIVGAGGFGREVRMLIDQINRNSPQWEYIGFFDDDFQGCSKVDPAERLGGIDLVNSWKESLALVCAVGNPLVKRKILTKITNPKIYYPILVHPQALVGCSNVHIGAGSILCAGSIVTVDIKIGCHVILNLSCTVGHDTVIGDYCSFMPAVNISGEVQIGEAVYAGTGAKIINRLTIGEEAILGAGSVVLKSVPPRCTVVGVPAKLLKFHRPSGD